MVLRQIIRIGPGIAVAILSLANQLAWAQVYYNDATQGLTVGSAEIRGSNYLANFRQYSTGVPRQTSRRHASRNPLAYRAPSAGAPSGTRSQYRPPQKMPPTFSALLAAEPTMTGFQAATPRRLRIVTPPLGRHYPRANVLGPDTSALTLPPALADRDLFTQPSALTDLNTPLVGPSALNYRNSLFSGWRLDHPQGLAERKTILSQALRLTNPVLR